MILMCSLVETTAVELVKNRASSPLYETTESWWTWPWYMRFKENLNWTMQTNLRDIRDSCKGYHPPPFFLFCLSLLISKRTKSTSDWWWLGKGKEIRRGDIWSLWKEIGKCWLVEQELVVKLSCQFPLFFGHLSALVLPSKELMTLAESVSITGGEAWNQLGEGEERTKDSETSGWNHFCFT